MFLAKLSIDRPVMTTMGILIFLIFGALSYINLNLNQMPDVEIPFVTIQTVYPGAGPKEIETLISKRIEESVSTISQIKRVESYSLDGVSIVMIEFELGKDIDVANQETKDKVDIILNDLPDDAELPIVQKVDFTAFPIVDVILSGDLDPRTLYEFADKTLKDRFSQINGVARVDVVGGQEREIRVMMDNKIVFENSISFPQLIQILAAQNMDLPGGYFQIDNQEYTVRFNGEFDDLQEMRDMQIPTMYGAKKLGQFAAVVDSGKDIRQRSVYYNVETKNRDANAVKLGIVKAPDGNVVKVADAIKSAIPDIQTILPKGAKMEIIKDNSIFVRASVDDTISNILLGVLFTSIVLLLFLSDIRSTFIVALSMPTSIISTFLLLSMFDLTLNMMTLMGLSVSVGVLVANSVVVLENIFRHKNMGKDNKMAAYKGTTGVTTAVLAATMTNLVVFLPIANMSSIVGQFLKELALAASFATIFSLIFSFTLTPMLASLIMPKKTVSGKIKTAMDRFYAKWDNFYRFLLTYALRNKWISLLIVIFAFIITVISVGFYGPKLGFEFMPNFDDGEIRISVELPEGYNLESTASVLEEIEKLVKQEPAIEHLVTTLGKKSDLEIGTNMANMEVLMVDDSERDITTGEMIQRFVKKLANIPNAKIVVNYANTTGAPGDPIEFYLLGQEVDQLEIYKEQVNELVKDVPGLINFQNSSRAGKPEISVVPDREKMSDAGITVQEMAITVRAAVEGIESTKYREAGEEYDIKVTLNDASVSSPDQIGNITLISSMTGMTYRLKELADINFSTGFTRILHRDKYTTIKFTGSNAEGVPVGNVTNEIDARLENLALPAGYYIKWGGNTEMMNEMLADMAFAFLLAVLLTYMLLAAILESFLQPFYILLTLPLALIGVVISLYYTNIALGITSLMAIIMLIGIVVNNAILMLDYTNQLIREAGLTAKQALIQACPVKLKPILMSTLAIILGMLPLALGIGEAGKEMRQPLGVVSIGGLIVSMVMTLFVIPSFYYLLSRSKKRKLSDLPVH
jgi:hydrophobic/amphiphilic exporter-1 (mainly G- bacteria), HAE1 family